MSKADTFIRTFMMHRATLGELIDVMSDKDVDFRPFEGALSTGELVAHMLTTGLMFAEASATGKIERQTLELHNVAETKEAYKTYTDKTTAAIESMSDEQFDTMIDMTKVFGRELPASSLLHSMRDHEIHHKGQLFTYLRICGVEKLPFFIKAN